MDHSNDELLQKVNIKVINATAVRGTGICVQANKIETSGIKVIQMTPSSPAEHLPELWMVPTQNINFIGRNELLKQIEDHFS